MSKYEEANLILKLYELRREETMRKARDWTIMGFAAESLEDFSKAMFSEQGSYLRMVFSYWDMAAALVNHGAISVDLFNETNSEYIGVFGKIEPFLEEIRAAYSPQFLTNLEKLIDSVPDGRKRTAEMRERLKVVRAQMASQASS